MEKKETDIDILRAVSMQIFIYVKGRKRLETSKIRFNASDHGDTPNKRK